MPRSKLTLLMMSAAAMAMPSPLTAQATPPATPVAAPFDARFAALDESYRKLVDEGKLAGVVTLVAHRGQLRHVQAYGLQDIDTKTPVRPDTIWRIASMTKPVTGVAMMILYEQGKWKLDDPVAKFIPEFRDLKVKAQDGKLVPQQRPMTMRELMSHTAGFGASGGPGLRETDLQGMIDKLAQTPLAYQPGTDWVYGPSVDIQGYIVEKLSGQRLDRFMQDRIFTPLGMVDTQFWVDPSKLSRLSRLHAFDETGKLVGADAVYPIATAPPRFLAGGGGLYSTAPDYLRFAQMLLGGGSRNGTRILKSETVALMQRNVLQPGIKVDLYGPSMEGIGFGLDFGLVTDPAAARTPQGRGSYYWGGTFGTWFWIDPANELIMIGMIQNVNGSTPGGGTPSLRPIAYPLVYKAIGQPVPW